MIIQQITREIRCQNYAVADQLSTKLLMHYKYPTKPYNISMDLKAALKSIQHAKGTEFKEGMNAISNDISLLSSMKSNNNN